MVVAQRRGLGWNLYRQRDIGSAGTCGECLRRESSDRANKQASDGEQDGGGEGGTRGRVGP